MRRPKRQHSTNHTERAVINRLSDLSDFQDFKKDLLPKIRKMMKEGKKAKDIIDLSQTMAAARLATIAVTDEDSKTALAAALAILDRTMGKPTEKKEITHAMAGLKEQELDAVVLTALNDAAADDLIPTAEVIAEEDEA